jgi:hypothetical protein
MPHWSNNYSSQLVIIQGIISTWNLFQFPQFLELKAEEVISRKDNGVDKRVRELHFDQPLRVSACYRRIL